MKRLHVLSIAFLAGMISGLSVPSHAMASTHNHKTFKDVTIDQVNSDECSIEADSETFYFSDCEDSDLFTEGDTATLITSDFTKTLVNSDGDEADLN